MAEPFSGYLARSLPCRLRVMFTTRLSAQRVYSLRVVYSVCSGGLLLVAACGDDRSDTGRVRDNPEPTPQLDSGIDTKEDAGNRDAGSGANRGSDAVSVTTDTTTGVGSDSGASPGGGTTSPLMSESTSTPPNVTSDTTSTTTTPEQSPLLPGWDRIESPFPGLDDCQDLMLGGELTCVYALKCGTRTYNARCTDLGAGQWDCSCDEPLSFTREEYTLDGASAEAACRVGLGFCVYGHGPELSDQECVHEARETSSTQCQGFEVCTYAAQLEGGVRARLRRSNETNHCDHADGYARCECSANYDVHEVYGTEGTESCRLMSDVCAGTTTLGTEIACSSERLASTSTSCSFSQSCGARTDLGEGVHLLSDPTPLGSFCDTYEAGVVGCECVDGQQSISAEVDAPSVQDACLTSASLCKNKPTLDGAGPPLCSETTTGVSETTCTTNTTCSWVSSFEQATITEEAPLAVDCENAAGEWSCICASGDGRSELQPLSGSNGHEVCEQAIGACAARITALEYRQQTGAQFIFGDAPVSNGDAGAR